MKRLISFILMFCLLVPLGAISVFADDGSSWELKEFVDDFGDPTGETYLRSIVSGTFSNTATSDENMKVVIGYLPQKLGDNYVPTLTFRVVEYDDTLKVKATYTESDDITIKVKIDDEITEGQLIGTPPNGDLRLIGGPCILKIYDTLVEAEQDVRTIIEIGSSKYSFTIDSEGFVNCLNEYNELNPESVLDYYYRGTDILRAEYIVSNPPIDLIGPAFDGGTRYLLYIVSFRSQEICDMSMGEYIEYMKERYEIKSQEKGQCDFAAEDGYTISIAPVDLKAYPNSFQVVFDSEMVLNK